MSVTVVWDHLTSAPGTGVYKPNRTGSDVYLIRRRPERGRYDLFLVPSYASDLPALTLATDVSDREAARIVAGREKLIAGSTR